MIRLVKQLSVLVLIGVIANGVASAKTIKKGITFAQPVVVNGTVVKKGAYHLVFDDQTNELTILKDGKVVATSPAQLGPGAHDHAVYITRDEGASAAPTLLSVSVGKDTLATLENNSSGNSAQ